MVFGQFALAVSALFAGAAVYVNVVEQPARLRLDDRALLTEWKPAYKRGFAMQSSLAILAFILGMLAWWHTGNWQWSVGAVLMIANWPFTLVVIMPTNKQLMAMTPEQSGPRSRQLIETWAGLHAVRSALGILATVAFVWAMNA